MRCSLFPCRKRAGPRKEPCPGLLRKNEAGSDDAVRGRGVEHVRADHGELERDGLADLGVKVGFDAGDAGGIDTGVEVEIDFGAHGLADIDLGGDGRGTGIVRGAFGADVLGTDAEEDVLADIGLDGGVPGGGQGDGDRAGLEDESAVLGGERALEDVHGRGADEAGDEGVRGPVIDIQRGVDLLDDAVLHNADAVAHGHGLDLVVRDVDHGGAEAGMELVDFGAHLDAHLGVEVGERFVEEEDGGLADDGAADGDALALAAGEGLRLAFEVVADAEDIRGLQHALVDLGLRELAELEAEREVFIDRHVRIEGVVLKHHGDVAILRRDVVHDAFADPDLAVGDLFESGDHAESRGLTASGGTDEDHEFLVVDVDGNAVDGLHAAFIDLADIFKDDFSHVSPENGLVLG